MKSKDIIILAIETSCDETGIAILKFRKNGSFKILANIIASQIKVHAPFGGVVPHLAAREHEKNLPICLKKALKQAKINWPKIDYISVTQGPGLSPALWRGINFAKKLAKKHKKKVIAINHLEGHIYSCFLTKNNSSFIINNLSFPALALLVSGGHTQLVLMKNQLKYKLLGQTLDDAAGEAFDKTAKLLNLGYPGGPIVSKISERGNATAYNLPRPIIYSKNYNFSFSGLKTAVLYLVRNLVGAEHCSAPTKKQIQDICASFQQAVIDVLIHKTIKASQKFKPKIILFGGGVIANKKLRQAIKSQIPNYYLPITKYCGDNAVMIALAGYKHALKKDFISLNELDAKPNLKL